MEIKQFKIRCSQIGKIMSDPKSKTAKEAGELGETAKTYCELWLKEQIYDKSKEVKSKYFDKGIICENAAIDRLNNFELTFYSKNEECFENDFLIGTPDIIGSTEIIDIKNSYDFSTFPLFETEIENKDYFYQLQGYMALTGIKRAKLVYCLENLPDELIEMELNKLGLEFTLENASRFMYDNVDEKLRIKTFEIDYDAAIIEKINSQVLKCRSYINYLSKIINDTL